MTTVSLVEELWFGDGSDSVAEQKAAAGMARLSSRVLELRSIPSLVLKIIDESRSASGSVGSVARLIESEASFSLRVLRLANSAAMGQRVRCTSIRHAVALLGVKSIAEVSMAMAALDLYDDQSPLGCRLREHATVVAGLARHLAMRLGLPADNVYTCGLMHDLGKLFLHQGQSDYDDVVLAPCGDGPDQAHLLEREALGFDHAVLAAHVLNAWGIPDPIPTIVAWHHQPARAYAQGGAVAEAVSLLRVADGVAHALQVGEATEELIPGLARDASADYLGLREEQLQEWWSELLTVARASREPLGQGEDALPQSAAGSEAPQSNPPVVATERAEDNAEGQSAPARSKAPLAYWVAGVAAILLAALVGLFLR